MNEVNNIAVHERGKQYLQYMNEIREVKNGKPWTKI